MRRLQAELLTEADSERCLLIVGARAHDQAEAFSELLTRSIEASGRVVERGDAPSSHRSNRGPENSGALAIIDIPALLERSGYAAALHRPQSGEALLITRHNTTSLRDAKEVMALLGMNNIAVRGIIILRNNSFSWQRSAGPPVKPATKNDDSEFPWPAIDVLEAEKTQRAVRAD
jgi:hypothetical protein